MLVILRALVCDGVVCVGEVCFGDVSESFVVDDCDDWPDASDDVGACGGGVVVGCVPERFECDGDGVCCVELWFPEFFQCAACEDGA